MAKSKMNSFLVDGMTVEQILSLDQKVINNMNKRDLSRAVRTIALAANKRIDRLNKNKDNIASDSLNWLKDEKGSTRFGSSGKTIQQLKHEYKIARQFMKMKTSTVKGAVGVRKGREERIMGMTKEEAVKRAKNDYIKQFQKTHKGRKPAERTLKRFENATIKEFQQNTSNAWEIFRNLLAEIGIPNSPYRNFQGSSEIIEMIGKRTAEGASEEDILAKARSMYDANYEQQQNEFIDEFYDEDDEFLEW